MRRQHVVVDDLFSTDPSRSYWYSHGYNPAAVISVILAGAASIASVLVPRLVGTAEWVSDYSWFIGCGVGYVTYLYFMGTVRRGTAGTAGTIGTAGTDVSGASS